MGAPQYEQAGADIGGTGTTNTIPRWTGPSTLGDSGLIDNGTAIYTTARNVGIGTPSPGALLDVSSGKTVGTGGFRVGADVSATSRTNNTRKIGSLSVPHYDNTASDASLMAMDANTTTNTLYIGGGWSQNAATSILFYTGATSTTTTGSERARIDSSGNLILNTANTGATIQAAGSQQGLKLPATPGNADTQTLDAYREDTFTTSFSGLGNCSNVSASNLRFTQIGRLVTIEGTFTFTVTAATTQTNFNFTLPSGRNRGSTANAGCGIGVDNASTFTGAIWNASGDATTAAIYFGPTNPFGAGTVRTVPFSYSYYTAT